MRVDDPRGKRGIGRFETDIQQVAVRYALHRETSQEFTEFGRALLVCQSAGSQCLRGPVRGREFRAGGKGVVANRLQRQRFAG